MTRYIVTGRQALEFPDLRVNPGEEFDYELDAAREASLCHSIKRVEPEPEPEPEEKPRKGGR